MRGNRQSLSIQQAGLWAVSLGLGWLAFSTGVEWLLPRVMDFDGLKHQITDQVVQSTGLQLSVEKIRIRPTLFHGVRVSLRGVTLRDSQEQMMGQARRAVIYIRYLPLLKQQGAISGVEIQRPNVRLGKDSAWFHLHLPKTQTSQVYLDNAKVGLYNARVVTNFLPGAGDTPAMLSGKAFEVDHLESPYPVTAFAKGAVSVGSTESLTPLTQFVVKAKVRQHALLGQSLVWGDVMDAHVGLRDAHLATLSRVFAQSLPFKTTGDLQQLVVTLHHPKGAAKILVEAKTQVPVVVQTTGRSVHLFPLQALFQASLPGNPLAGDFRLDKVVAQVESAPLSFTFDGMGRPHKVLQKSTFAGHLTLKKLALPSLAKVTQWPEPLQTWLVNSQGQFSGRFNLSGPVTQPQVLGTLDLHGVGLLDPKTQRPLVQAVDGVIVHPSATQWDIREVSGKVAGGPFLLHGKYNTQGQSFTGRFQCNRLQLAPLRRLVSWLAPQTPYLSQVVTTGQLDAYIEGHGTVKHPVLTGWTQLHHGFLALSTSKTPLMDDLSGRLRIEKNRVYAEPLTLVIGGAPIKLLGGGNAQHIQLGVEAHQVPLAMVQRRLLAWQSFLGLPPSTLSQVTVSQGALSSDLTLSNSLSQPNLRGSARITGLAVNHAHTQVALTQGKATLQAGPKGLALTDTQALLEGIPVVLTGNVSPDWQTLAVMAETPSFDLAKVTPVIKKLVATVDPAMVLSGQGQFQGFVKGALRQPDWRGALRLSKTGGKYPSKKLTLADLNGQLIASPQGVEAVGLSGVLNTLRFAISGKTSFDLAQYQVALKSQEASLTALRDTVAGIFPELQAPLTQAGLQSGLATVDVQVSSAQPLLPTGHLTLKNINAKPQGLGLGVQLPQLDYNLASGQITMPGRGLRIGDLWFKLAGTATSQGYNLHLASERIPVATIRDSADLLMQVTMFRWPQLYNAQGEFQVLADMAPGAHTARLKFWKAGASMEGLKYPVYDIDGTLSLSLDKGFHASAEHLAFRFANSPMVLNMDINTLNDIYVDASGVLSPLMINDLLLSKGMTAVANVAMPFTLNASGTLASFWDAGTGNNLNLFVNFDIASLFDNPQLVHPGAMHVKNKALDNATLSSVVHLLGNVLKIEETRLKVGDNSGVMVSGEIHNLFSPGQQSLRLNAQTTPQVDLAELGKEWRQTIADGLSGLLAGQIEFLSAPSQTSLTGQVALSHVQSGPLAIDDLDGHVDFTGQSGMLTVNRFVIPGVDVAFTSKLPNLFQYPLPLSEFDLTGNQFIITLYADWMNQIFMNKIRQGFWEQFFPNTGRMGPLPFEITDGTLAIKEGVLNNLIIEDYTSKIRLYPNNYFELSDFQGRSAGGSAQGFYAMSPRDNNFMTVQMHLDKMKANAVARILLNVSNQIFGDLSGDIAYTTEGMTNEEMLAHTNGSATLWIEDGRLPQIAKIENLLVAANTFSGGLANLNLNSLFRMASPFNTNYFAKLTGTFKMVEGIIYTNDMKSDGRNLDLYFKGLVHMDTGVADMVLRGEMDRDIQGALGPLGQLSFGRFLGLIPPLRILISHIPGLGFVPGFGGPKTHKGVAFEAKIEGPAVDPGSVKSFKWVK